LEKKARRRRIMQKGKNIWDDLQSLRLYNVDK
jgi:hypothetical protein